MEGSKIYDCMIRLRGFVKLFPRKSEKVDSKLNSMYFCLDTEAFDFINKSDCYVGHSCRYIVRF